jgi:ketosteroid isomerase-like protein
VTALELVTRHIANIAKPVEAQDLSIYADSMVCEFPNAPEGQTNRLEGSAALAKFLANIGNFAPERHADQVEAWESGKDVIGLFRSNFKVTETGRSCSMPMILILRLQEGKIVRFREFYDARKVLIAFGELPEP